MPVFSQIIKELSKKLIRIFTKDRTDAGHEFGNHIRSHLFTLNSYELLERNSGAGLNTGKPAFKFRDIQNGREFYLVPVFSTRLVDGKIAWCSSKQLTEYRELDKHTPVFLLIGTGSDIHHLSALYLLPKKAARHAGIFPFYAAQFSIQVGPVSTKTLWMREEMIARQPV